MKPVKNINISILKMLESMEEDKPIFEPYQKPKTSRYDVIPNNRKIRKK